MFSHCVGIQKVSSLFVWSFLCTRNRSLKYMNSAKFANGCLMRWAMFLQSYIVRVEAIKGSANVGGDYLSRVEE